MNIAKSEKAVSDGLFFDLMYANGNPGGAFDPQKQYVFLRKYEDEALLVAVNFSDKAVECDVCLPRHAFEYMGLPEKTVTAVDLLSDDSAIEMPLKADGTVKFGIGAYGGRVYKFKL